MNEHPTPNDEPGLEAPPRLVSALRDLGKTRVFVPPQVDAAILREARRHLSLTIPTRATWQPWQPWAAVAASLLLLAWLGQALFRPGARDSFAREDINHDGRVDILDALALAKRVESGAPPRGADFNGDGVVDRRDADFIARLVVKLRKGERI
ncbi:MAG: hypothetical protein HY300_12660 [Verrucomicrobia bacterium]|nr:hypothetical protein [Verrucomicrobiota bacterium]